MAGHCKVCDKLSYQMYNGCWLCVMHHPQKAANILIAEKRHQCAKCQQKYISKLNHGHKCPNCEAVNG